MILIVLASLVVLAWMVVFVLGDKVYCNKCGKRMLRSYDEESDSESWFCPGCGHRYNIKG
jgi:DNA-directed RNA polymerase subunit RPC12/RpoP